MTDTRKPIWPLLAAGLFLTACSGEPSEADIRHAFEADIQGVNQVVEDLGGNRLKVVLHDLDKIGCEQDAGGYRCDVTTEVETPFLGRQKRTSTVRLVKTDEGWRLSQ